MIAIGKDKNDKGTVLIDKFDADEDEIEKDENINKKYDKKSKNKPSEIDDAGLDMTSS